MASSASNRFKLFCVATLLAISAGCSDGEQLYMLECGMQGHVVVIFVDDKSGEKTDMFYVPGAGVYFASLSDDEKRGRVRFFVNCGDSVREIPYLYKDDDRRSRNFQMTVGHFKSGVYQNFEARGEQSRKFRFERFCVGDSSGRFERGCGAPISGVLKSQIGLRYSDN